MYKQGDLVLIPVPFTDLTAIKKRPVIVISNDLYNRTTNDLIVVAVTSNVSQQGISLTTNNLTNGQMPKPSIVRSDKIYTLSQEIIVKQSDM